MNRDTTTLASRSDAEPGTFAHHLYTQGQAYLRTVLAECTSVREAAKRAGLNRTNFYFQLKRFKIEPPNYRGRGLTKEGMKCYRGDTRRRGKWDKPIPENW